LTNRLHQQANPSNPHCQLNQRSNPPHLRCLMCRLTKLRYPGIWLTPLRWMIPPSPMNRMRLLNQKNQLRWMTLPSLMNPMNPLNCPMTRAAPGMNCWHQAL
jgi:hypothetical protein